MPAPKSLCAALLIFLLSLAQAQAATATNKNSRSQTAIINKVEYKKAESFDKSLRFKKIFLFPSVDDIANVLAPQLDSSLREALEKNSRFELVRDSGVIKALNPGESGYGKVVVSEAVHKEAANITGADTTVVLRTRTVGGTTEMSLDWRDAEGKILFSEGGNIPGFSSLEARVALINSLVNATVKKIPFAGTITGRTANTVTIDLGRGSVQNGDVLDVVRLVSAQRHPLLGSLVNVDFLKVGEVRVTNADRVLSFGEITEEAIGENIGVDNKIIAVKKPRTREPEPSFSRKEEQYQIKEKNEDIVPKLEGDFDKPKARYGSIALDLNYGSLTHTNTSGGSTIEQTGSGISAGLAGEAWITRNWIAELQFSTQSATLSSPQGAAGDTNVRRIELAGLYKFFPGILADGTSISVGLGYQQFKFDLPASSALRTGQRNYSGLLFKVKGEILLSQEHKVITIVGFQPFASLEDSSGLGTSEGATSIGFQLGYGYQFSPNFWAIMGLRFDTANASYPGGATAADKKFAIGPSIAYSF